MRDGPMMMSAVVAQAGRPMRTRDQNPPGRLTALIAAALALVGLLLTAGAGTAQPPPAPPANGIPRCGAAASPNPRVPTLATPAASSPPLAFRLVSDVPLPGSASRFDYQSLDP